MTVISSLKRVSGLEQDTRARGQAGGKGKEKQKGKGKGKGKAKSKQKTKAMNKAMNKAKADREALDARSLARGQLFIKRA